MLGRSVIGLLLIASTLLVATGEHAHAYMEDNLLIRYDFNKGRGTVIGDQTGLGYDAQLHGHAFFIDNDPWSTTTGMANFGNAIALDGAGDYLTIESDFHNARLNLDRLAIAAWIRPANAGAGKQYLVSKLNHAARTGYALAIDNSTGFLHAEIYLDNSASLREIVGSTPIPNDAWTHVVASFDGDALKLYVNGELDSSISVAGSIAASDEKFTIAALSGVLPSNEFEGAIDELRLYSEISALNVNILASAENGEPGLIFYEPFDTINRILADSKRSGAKFSALDNTDLVEGQFDNALHFQDLGQENERLSWPVQHNLDATKGHITLWFRPDQADDIDDISIILTTDNYGLADKSAGDGIRIYRSKEDDRYLNYLMLARNNWVKSNFSQRIQNNTSSAWHHLELIWDTTSATPYLAYIVDGEIAGLNSDATTAASGMPITLFLGSSSSYSGMRGSIDELKIYSRPQYDVFNNAEKIAALTNANRADGIKQPFETVYNSADASLPDAALAAKEPVSFFQRAPFERVYPGDLPSADEVSDALGYRAAANDTESLFFNIYSQIDVDDVSITISDLKDAYGNTIVSAQDMQLMVVKNWWQRTESVYVTAPFIPVFVPELLMYDDRYNFKYDDYDAGTEASHSWDDLPDFPAPVSASVITELKAYASKQFMLNVRIPDMAASGNYTATATVTGDGLPGSRTLTLSIDVQNIALPKADKDFIIYHRAQYLGKPDELTLHDYVSDRNYYLAELQDIFDHGFNGISAAGTDHDYITDIKSIGFDGKVIMKHTAADPLTITALRNAFGEAWFYGRDEPENNTLLDKQMRRSSDIHATGGKVTTAIYLPWADCLSEPHDLRPDPDNGGLLKDFCPYTGSQPFAASAALDMENLNVYISAGTTQQYFDGLLNGTSTKDSIAQTYYWQSRAEDARVNRYFAGIHLFLTGMDGIWPYVYIHNDDTDPYDDLDAPTGNKERERGLVYPTRQGPMSTIEWEAMREGIDDYRYLQLWQSLHEAMIKENPAEAARSKARIELNEHGIGLSLYRYRIAGALNISNADFNATRELVAEEILALQSGLADPDGDTLSTAAELSLGTDPYDEDTDNDWLRDGIEVNITRTDPLEADSDSDGSTDFTELLNGTNPMKPFD